MKKNHIIKTLIIVIIAFFIGAVVSPSSGIIFEDKPMELTIFGNILYVGGDGPGNYSKIQDAIDNTSKGDTVFVYDDSSPYYENVVVDKSINLIGEDKDTTVIDDIVSGYVVSLSADWVNISGFTMRHGIYGIYIHSYYNNITSSTISNNLYGIYLNESNRNTISGNTIMNNEHGTFFSHSKSNTITNNIILNNNGGIVLFESNDNIITDNTISDNEHGTFLSHSKSNTITYNTLSDNEDGIYLSGYTGFWDFGRIFQEGSNNNIIFKNNFIGNKRDAFFQNSFSNQWKQNYWNRPRILPILIRGEICWITMVWLSVQEHRILWFPQIDWNPAKEPYDVENVDIFYCKV